MNGKSGWLLAAAVAAFLAVWGVMQATRPAPRITATLTAAPVVTMTPRDVFTVPTLTLTVAVPVPSASPAPAATGTP